MEKENYKYIEKYLDIAKENLEKAIGLTKTIDFNFSNEKNALNSLLNQMQDITKEIEWSKNVADDLINCYEIVKTIKEL